MAIEIGGELFHGAVTLVAGCAAAGFAAWLGVRVFFKQKEYELVKQRYLERGVDIVAAHIEEYIGTFDHNWARCLQLLKMFRDARAAFDPAELQRGFLTLDSSKFHSIAHLRIEILVGTDVYWTICQLALSTTASANAIATTEIPEAIRIIHSDPRRHAEIEHLIEHAYSRLGELMERSHRFAHLTRDLEALAGLLQTERLTFKSILTFRQNPTVIAVIDGTKAQFADDIKRGTSLVGEGTKASEKADKTIVSR